LPPEFKLFLPIQKQQWGRAFKKILQRYFYIFFLSIILSFPQSLQPIYHFQHSLPINYYCSPIDLFHS
jgi:hypothetical protein